MKKIRICGMAIIALVLLAITFVPTIEQLDMDFRFAADCHHWHLINNPLFERKTYPEENNFLYRLFRIDHGMFY